MTTPGPAALSPTGRGDGLLPSSLSSPPWDPRVVTGLAVGLVALHVALAWFGRSPGLLTGQDDATYVLLGRALREHFAYREIFEPGAPVHGKYPPVFPAVLAVWTGVFGESWKALASLGVLVSAGTLALVFDAVRRTVGPALALGSLAALSVNPNLVLRAGTAWSEPLYGLLAFASVWVLLRGDDRRHVWIAGAVAVAAAMTRMVGVALLAALVAHWALERRWRRAGALAAASVVTAGGWIAWSVAVAVRGTGGDSYLRDLPIGGSGPADAGVAGGAAADAGPGVVELLAEAGGAAWSFLVHGVTNLAGLLALGLNWRLPMPHIAGTPVDNAVTAGVVVAGIAAGIGLWLWRSWRPAGLYLAVSLVFLAVYPVPVARLLEPLLAFAVPTVLVGVTALAWRWGGGRTAVAAGGLVALAVTATGAVRTAPRVQERARCSEVDLDGGGQGCMIPAQRSYFDALAHIDRHVPEDALLLTGKPEPMYFYTGRQGVDDREAIRIPPDRFYSYLDRAGVDYVLLGDLRAIEVNNFLPRLETRCGRLEPAESFPPRTHLFRLLPASDAPETSGEAPGCRALEAYREATEGLDFTGDERLY